MTFLRTLILVGLSTIVLCSAAPAQKRQRGAVRIDPVTPPSVAEINLDALKGLLSKPKQRPLLVNFWATWCDPCRDEFPDLVKLDSEYRPRATLDFVTVSLDDVKVIKTDVPKFLSSMKATMPAYLLNVADPEPAINAVDPQWQGDLPATFLYNVNGEVVYKHFGRVDATELRTAIEKLVGTR